MIAFVMCLKRIDGFHTQLFLFCGFIGFGFPLEEIPMLGLVRLKADRIPVGLKTFYMKCPCDDLVLWHDFLLVDGSIIGNYQTKGNLLAALHCEEGACFIRQSHL